MNPAIGRAPVRTRKKVRVVLAIKGVVVEPERVVLLMVSFLLITVVELNLPHRML